MTDLAEPPRVVRIRAGDVVIELEWPTPPAGPGPASSGQRSGATKEDDAAEGPGASASGASTSLLSLVDICAPTVGTFYRAPEPGAGPFVVEGDHVRRGQQIGIVEAMKLMIPLEAEHEGDVVAVLVEDGTQVEYGDPLFTFAPVAG